MTIHVIIFGDLCWIAHQKNDKTIDKVDVPQRKKY